MRAEAPKVSNAGEVVRAVVRAVEDAVAADAFVAAAFLAVYYTLVAPCLRTHLSEQQQRDMRYAYQKFGS
jgi:hypothetical protein